jgi:hypothetical protein
MRCANPGCKTETLYFRSGSLHWIDRDAEGRATALIWLCESCTRAFVVEPWRPAGQQMRRRKVVGVDTRPGKNRGDLPASIVTQEECVGA